MIQIKINGGEYFLEPFNWMQLLGNMMVVNYTQEWYNMDEYLWFMVFCLTMNAVASLKIF